jgi:hypothetical protein
MYQEVANWVAVILIPAIVNGSAILLIITAGGERRERSIKRDGE